MDPAAVGCIPDGTLSGLSWISLLLLYLPDDVILPQPSLVVNCFFKFFKIISISIIRITKAK